MRITLALLAACTALTTPAFAEEMFPPRRSRAMPICRTHAGRAAE